MHAPNYKYTARIRVEKGRSLVVSCVCFVVLLRAVYDDIGGLGLFGSMECSFRESLLVKATFCHMICF